MNLTFAGTGAAFCIGEDMYQSNMILEVEGRRLLIDCGSDIRRSLERMGLSARHFDALYVSHLHSDHVGGIEWFCFTRHFDPGVTRAKLFAVEELIAPLWEHSLRGGLEIADATPCTLETYFDVMPVDSEKGFDFNGSHLEIVPCPHVVIPNATMLSYGLFARGARRNFYLSTDMRFEPERQMPHWRRADIIFQDCETSPTLSGVHAHYSELKQLPDDIRAKMWLYDYQPPPLPDAVADGFAGFVVRGQTFDFDRP